MQGILGRLTIKYIGYFFQKKPFIFCSVLDDSLNSLIMKLVISFLFCFVFLLNSMALGREYSRLAPYLLCFSGEKELFSDLPEFYTVKSEEDALRDITYPRLLLLDLDGVLNRAEPKQISHSEIMMAMTEFSVDNAYAGKKLLVGLDYLSDNEILIRDVEGRLMSKVIVSDLTKISIEIDISRLPIGDYIINDGNSSINFSKK